MLDAALGRLASEGYPIGALDHAAQETTAPGRGHRGMKAESTRV